MPRWVSRFRVACRWKGDPRHPHPPTGAAPKKVASRVARAFTAPPTRRGHRQYASPACTPTSPAQPPTPAICCACCTAPPGCHPADHDPALPTGPGPASQIADLLRYNPSTLRRWIHCDHRHGTGGLADLPRAGRPRLGSPRLAQRILTVLTQPRGWTIPSLWHAVGRPPISLRTLHRRVRQVASWRRPAWSHEATLIATRSWPTCTSSSSSSPTAR
jgi:Homeodomain-like domain